MSNSILILADPISQYHVGNYFLFELGKEWERLGHRVMTRLDERPDWIVSINGYASKLIIDPRLACARRLEVIMDDPVTLAPIFYSPIPDLHLAVIDRVGVEALDRLRGWQGRSHFAPHGAVPTPEGCVPRSTDVLLCGSYQAPSDLKLLIDKELSRVPSRWRVWMNEAIAAERMEPLSALFEPADWQWLWKHPELRGVVQFVDWWVRYARRDRALGALGKAGVVVDLYGQGWGRSPHASSHRVHPPCSFEKILNLMPCAKVVLNIMPNFGYALHERLLTAMGAGAVVASDRNPFIEETFEDGRSIVLADDPVDLAARVEELLSDDTGREEIGREGQRVVKTGHMWSHRAQALHHRFFMEESLGL